MLIEASKIKGLPVVDPTPSKLGVVDFLVFDGDKGALIGMQVLRNGVIKKFFGLAYQDCDPTSLNAVVVDEPNSLQYNLRNFDTVYKQFGPVINVRAVTESGKRLGNIDDIFIDSATGLIIRFVLREIVIERIIPRSYVVSITPKQVVFQDVVNDPTFDKLATNEIATEPSKAS